MLLSGITITCKVMCLKKEHIENRSTHYTFTLFIHVFTMILSMIQSFDHISWSIINTQKIFKAFLEILQYLHLYFCKKLVKCFPSTTCIVMFVTGSNSSWGKRLRMCSSQINLLGNEADQTSLGTEMFTDPTMKWRSQLYNL